MNATAPASRRIASIDVIRGLVMILMSIDHVRVFSGLPAGGATAGIFFTRWITHFCAPAFVFLAGTSSFLYGLRRPDLTRFLVVRGLWLVLLELTVLRFAWTFNAEPFFMAGVIWAIGWSMVVLGVLVRFLPVWSIGVLGLVVIAGHDLVDGHLATLVPRLTQGTGSAFWKILYFGFRGGPIALGSKASLIVLYSLVPWVGVMAAGYAFGRLLLLEPRHRDRICVAIGSSAIALFAVLRGFNLYGDPRPWSSAGPMPALFSFLNTSKYPASLSYLLMTLGPTLLALPIAERLRGPIGAMLTVLGRVPLFYYLLHIPLIHVLALGVSWLRIGRVSPWLFANHPMGSGPAPAGYTWSLTLLYATALVANVILLALCRWYGRYKASHSNAWLRYL